MLRPDFNQHKIRETGPEREAEFGAERLQARASVENLAKIIGHELLVADGHRQTSERNRIHIERWSDAANVADLLSVAQHGADAKSGESVGLGEGPRNKEVVVFR